MQTCLIESTCSFFRRLKFRQWEERQSLFRPPFLLPSLCSRKVASRQLHFILHVDAALLRFLSFLIFPPSVAGLICLSLSSLSSRPLFPHSSATPSPAASRPSFWHDWLTACPAVHVVCVRVSDSYVVLVFVRDDSYSWPAHGWSARYGFWTSPADNQPNTSAPCPRYISDALNSVSI